MPIMSLGGVQGFYIALSNGSDIVARLARADMNMPNYVGFPISMQAPEAKFEAAVYKLLRTEPNILVSVLLCIPVQRDGPRLDPPQDLAGRRLLLFDKVEGDKNVWWDLSLNNKVRANAMCLPRSFSYLC